MALAIMLMPFTVLITAFKTNLRKDGKTLWQEKADI